MVPTHTCFWQTSGVHHNVSTHSVIKWLIKPKDECLHTWVRFKKKKKSTLFLYIGNEFILISVVLISKLTIITVDTWNRVKMTSWTTGTNNCVCIVIQIRLQKAKLTSLSMVIISMLPHVSNLSIKSFALSTGLLTVHFKAGWLHWQSQENRAALCLLSCNSWLTEWMFFMSSPLQIKITWR